MSEYTPTGPEAGPRYSPAPLPSRAPSSNLPLVSMVLGILSFVCCGPFFSLPAVIVGHLALGRIKRGEIPEDSRGFAVAGLTLGYINLALSALVIFIYLVVIVIAVVGGAGDVSPFIYQI